MKALILAAGQGRRLGLERHGPKCLAPLGAYTILGRSLDALDSLGLPVTIVVGHAAHQIEQHVAGRRLRPTLTLNDRYREGSVVSLAVGLAALDHATEAGGVPADVLLLDGDVAFTPSLLQRLVEAAPANALLVDVGTVFTDEQYMAGMRGDRVVTLRRGPADGHDTQGEWIGFTKLSARTAATFLAAASVQIARGDTGGGYEDALAGLLADVEFTAVPTGGLPWVEIDFAADLARARELFASAHAGEAGRTPA